MTTPEPQTTAGREVEVAGVPPASFDELRLERVTRAFGRTDALVDLSLVIRRGEFIAFLGPSGSGKSTALNCLAGLLALTDGAIWLDQRRIDHLPPERRDFAMVFQNYALFPHMSVSRNVAFGPKMRRLPGPEVRRRVEEALDLVKLGGHADKYPGQLSGGEQQRVAIARAIATGPRLVLMDEPLSNLDAQLRLDMRTEIRRLHQELGLTTVYVTHDQQEAMSLADRMVVLDRGRVQQIGTPEEVYANPDTSFVAGFMGYRNMFPGSVSAGGDRRVTVSVKEWDLTGITPHELSDGDSVVVALRPEDIRLAVSGEGDDNQIDVTVDVIEYAGREYAVGGVTATGLELRFLTPHPLTLGSQVTVAVVPERVRVYPTAPPESAEGSAG